MYTILYYLKMLKCFLKISVPAVLTNMIAFATVVTNGVFAGHMDRPVYLASMGLASVCCNITVLSVPSSMFTQRR